MADPTGAPGMLRHVGVPVVDLTLLVRQCYDDADHCRTAAHRLVQMAAAQRRRADFLEQLATTLDGSDGH